MKRNALILLSGLLTLIILTGCMSVTSTKTKLLQGPDLDKTRPIKVFKVDENVFDQYEVLGVVTASIETAMNRASYREDDRLESLQADASSMGADALIGYYTGKILADTKAYYWSSALAARMRRPGQQPLNSSSGYMVAVPKVNINKVVDSEERAELLDKEARKSVQYYLALNGYYAVPVDEPTPDPAIAGFQAMNEEELNKYGGPQAQYILGIKFLDKSYFTLLVGSRESVTMETYLYSKSKKGPVWQGKGSGSSTTGFITSMANAISEQRIQEAIREAASDSLKDVPNISDNRGKN